MQKTATLTPSRKILWANRYCLLDTSNGASLSVRQQLLQLKRRGWEVKIIGATVFDHERGKTLFRRYEGLIGQGPVMGFLDPDGLAHHLVVTRHWHCNETRHEELEQLYGLYDFYLKSFQPDLVYFYGGQVFDRLLAEESASRGIATVAYIANPNYRVGDRWCRDVDRIVTNSEATASFYREKISLDVTPLGTFVEPAKVIADTHERRTVLFVNPSVAKGATIVATLAYRMLQIRPDIPFEVVESRGTWGPVVRTVTEMLGDARDELPNVTVLPNQADMRPIYARARVLLAPSLWWESGARVLVEAMLNGIPAVVTDYGGNPEMIGDAGLKLRLHPVFHKEPYTRVPNPEMLDELVEKIICWYDDEAEYRTYVERAYRVAENKHNLEINTERLITVFEETIVQCKAKSEHEYRRIRPHKHPQINPDINPLSRWYESAGAMAAFLERLLSQEMQPLLLSSLSLNNTETVFSERLTKRFGHYCYSNKAQMHGCERLYARLLAAKQQKDGVLMKFDPLANPLGEKHENILFAFQDVLPHFKFYRVTLNANIDGDIFFKDEEGISTFYISGNEQALGELQKQFIGLLDFIIADGRYNSYAVFNALLFAKGTLKLGGIAVIENISPKIFSIWCVASRILTLLGHRCVFYQADREEDGLVFVFEKCKESANHQQ